MRNILQKIISGMRKPKQPDSTPLSLKVIDWQQSNPHLKLLAEFQKPCAVEKIEKNGSWDAVLMEPTGQAIARFQAQGMLVPADPEATLLALFTSSDLQRFLVDFHLPITGIKGTFAKRLLRRDEAKTLALIQYRMVLILTEVGWKTVTAYLITEKARKDDALTRCREALQGGRYRDAVMVWAKYNAASVNVTGDLTDWQNFDPSRYAIILDWIFSKTPKLAGVHGWEKIPDIRLYAALVVLWGNLENAGLEYDAEKDAAARSFTRHAWFQSNLQDYLGIGCSTFKIQRLKDKKACEACKEASRNTYSLKKLPELPLENCTCEFGCRCRLMMVD